MDVWPSKYRTLCWAHGPQSPVSNVEKFRQWYPDALANTTSTRLHHPTGIVLFCCLANRSLDMLALHSEAKTCQMVLGRTTSWENARMHACKSSWATASWYFYLQSDKLSLNCCVGFTIFGKHLPWQILQYNKYLSISSICCWSYQHCNATHYWATDHDRSWPVVKKK